MSQHSPGVALISGATGVVGRRLAEHLVQSGWQAIGIARRTPSSGNAVRWLELDLTDAAAVRAAARELGAVTHLFHCARYSHGVHAREPIEANRDMLVNLVESTERYAAGLAHVHLVHGSKYYGSDLGPYKTPAKETDPRVLMPNWYYAQEDWLVAHARGKRWSWSTSRPHAVCDGDLGNARNLARIIAVYAAVCSELGLPLCFPGSEAAYRALYQSTDAGLLARAIAWMATEPRCAGEAFNVINGDYFRWTNLWPQFARHFGMPVGPVRSVRLEHALADKGALWARLVERHGLVPSALDEVALWSYGDFVFNSGYDIVSDATKLKRFGFWETVDSAQMFLGLFDHYRRHRVVP